MPNRPPYNDTNHLGVFTWYHLAGTYDRDQGMMRLYLNGNEIASKSIGKGGVQTVPAEVRVGKAAIKRVPTDGTHDTLPSEFGIDGLIDEVRIYNTALTVSQVAAAFASRNPGTTMVRSPDMQKRGFPVLNTIGKFGALPPICPITRPGRTCFALALTRTWWWGSTGCPPNSFFGAESASSP